MTSSGLTIQEERSASHQLYGSEKASRKDSVLNGVGFYVQSLNMAHGVQQPVPKLDFILTVSLGQGIVPFS
jgi:hypothetical protein